MSDISNMNRLTRVPIQPPLSWYFDAGALEVEQRLLFNQGRIMSAMNCWSRMPATITCWKVQRKCWCATGTAWNC